MTPDFTNHFYIKQPEEAGSWIICERFNVYATKKPCWLHRKMSKLLLGWEWIDEKAQEK